MRLAALLGVCAVAGAVVLGFTTLGGSNGQAARPALRIIRSTPVTIRGDHFRSHEQMRVKTRARTTRVTAGANGVFVVRIPGATRCDLLRVVAIGSAGSYAVLKSLPPPMCMPARSG